jgi:hypothetical protein
MANKKRNTKTGRSQWEREVEKESFWRTKIAAWRASGQTVRSFARANGLSEPLFYSWRREISIRDRELNAAVAGGMEGGSGYGGSRVADARGRLVPLKFRDTPNGGAKTGPFVPVTLLANATDTAKPQTVPERLVERSAAEPVIDIKLPGRSILQITKDTDLVLLSQILAALEV